MTFPYRNIDIGHKTVQLKKRLSVGIVKCYYCVGDEIEKNEKGGSCSSDGEG
jgi:hypothetical protein